MITHATLTSDGIYYDDEIEIMMKKKIKEMQICGWCCLSCDAPLKMAYEQLKLHN